MKAIVLDSSALIPLFLPDENDAYSQKIIQYALKSTPIITATFCLLEFGNVIAVSIRRKRLTEADASFAYKKLSALPITYKDFVTPAQLPNIHNIASRRGLSFYDALYLALAIDEGASLATLDAALKKAAMDEGVPLI